MNLNFFLLILICAFYTCFSSNTLYGNKKIRNEWESFKQKNNLKFELKDEVDHYETFVDNLIKVQDHNKEFKNNKTSYYVKLNKFSYVREEEIKGQKFGLKSFVRSNSTEKFDFQYTGRALVPDTVDWKSYSVAIKDQRNCGSCWAFAAIGVVETLNAIKNKKFKRLSEQQLIDCTFNDNKYLSYGCDGGFPDNAFEYIKQNGVVEESDYPYKERNDACQKKNANKVKISNHYNLPEGDEDTLKKAVALYGPVAVGIDASQWGFSHYSGGIYSDKKCSSTDVNHAVIVIGYGTENNVDYWLIKNSWGTDWGMNGYMKMERNSKNMCGIATMPSFAIM